MQNNFVTFIKLEVLNLKKNYKTVEISIKTLEKIYYSWYILGTEREETKIGQKSFVDKRL